MSAPDQLAAEMAAALANPHTHLYRGYLVTKLPAGGGVVFRKPGQNGQHAKSILAAYTAIKKAVRGTPKGSGAVLPEEQTTNRLWRDWARRKATIAATPGEALGKALNKFDSTDDREDNA